MSFVQNNTLFSYKDLYSVQNSDNSVTCRSSISCVTTDCNGTTNAGCTNCYNQEYCTNKTYANQLQTHSQKYLGKNQEYNDMSQIYNSEYIKSVNLMVGIIGVLSFIFYNK
jgi:PPE-repeat protein